MTRSDVKLSARYMVLVFIMYLAWFVTQPAWLNEVKGIDAMNINVIVTAIFGGLTFVIKSHFENVVGGSDDKR